MAKASNAPSNASAFLLGIIATILLGWLFKVGSVILQPLAIAMLLASMLAPVVRFGARFRVPPMVSVLGMVSLLFYGIVQLVFLAQANLAVFLEQPAPIEVSSIQAPTGTRAAQGTGTAAPGAPGVEPPTEVLHGDTPADADDASKVSEGSQADPSRTSDAGPERSKANDPGASPAELAGGAEATEGQLSAEQVEEAENDGRRLDPVSASQAERIAEVGGISRLIDNLSARLDRSALPDQLVAYLKKELAEFKAEDRATQLAQAFLGSGVNVFRTMLLVVIYMLFIFAEQAVFRRKILAVAGDRREDAARVLDTMARGIQQFLGIKTLISVATGAICYSMLVALQIPYALLWGILTFALNFIPYFGSLLAGIFATATALAVEPTVDKALIVAIGYFTVNTVLGSIVEPKVMGRELDLSPLVILFSVVVWGTLWGLVGAFLAVPLTAAIQIVLASSDATRPIAVMLSSGPPRDSRRSVPRLPYKQAG
jgi:predicted PurR-regulated permease PerM